MGVVTSGWNGMEQNMTPLFKKKKTFTVFVVCMSMQSIHACSSLVYVWTSTHGLNFMNTQKPFRVYYIKHYA